MTTFTTAIKLEMLGDGKSWRLIEEFEYHIGEYPSENIIKVPFGFITDLMTVPRIVLPFFNPLLPCFAKPAIIHDFLYDKSSGPAVTRRQADKILLEAMSILNIPKWQRYLIYLIVRCFAGKQYNTTVSNL